MEHRKVDLSAEDYDRRWEALAAEGESVHGEADLVDTLLVEHGLATSDSRDAAVLDAGCGTGRVAVELHARGYAVTGVDLDPALLDTARRKDRAVEWITADLAALGAEIAPGPFAAVVAAGNVMIFVARGTEAEVVANVAPRLCAGGLFVAGFQVLPGRLGIDEYDAHCEAAGLEPVAHWATWDRAPLANRVDYVVAVHHAPGAPDAQRAAAPGSKR